MSTPLHHRSTDTPPTLDLFLHPSDFKQAPNTTISTSTALPISSKDLNKFSFCSSSSSRISSTASQLLTARRLTPDGDIQYLVTTAPSWCRQINDWVTKQIIISIFILLIILSKYQQARMGLHCDMTLTSKKLPFILPLHIQSRNFQSMRLVVNLSRQRV